MSNVIQALIIDDDANNLEVIGRLLEMERISCIRMQNASQIHAALGASLRADVIFLDLEMPNIDGYQVFQLLRRALGPAVPIVACTVHLNEATTVRELGFDGFIAKPLEPKRFAAQVKQILSGEQVWDI